MENNKAGGSSDELLHAKAELIESKESMDEKFCRVSIDDFMSAREVQKDVRLDKPGELNYPIYFRLSEFKYLKIAANGGDLPAERLRGYRSKGTRFLYVQKQDFQKYLGFNLDLVRAADNSDAVTKEQRMKLIKHANEVVLNNLYTNGVDENTLEAAKVAVETVSSTLMEFQDACDLIMMLNNNSDYLYSRSVAMSLYSAMIARRLHWNSPGTLFKISVAGFLADIGKKEIEASIALKPRIQLTPIDVKLIESHPVRSMEILSKIPSIPREVLQIVLQHHENCYGGGYPVGLKKNQIHPIARLVAVADKFSELVLKGPDGPGVPAENAFDQMITFYSEALDSTFVIALMAVFHCEPPKEYMSLDKKWKAA